MRYEQFIDIDTYVDGTLICLRNIYALLKQNRQRRSYFRDTPERQVIRRGCGSCYGPCLIRESINNVQHTKYKCNEQSLVHLVKMHTLEQIGSTIIGIL